MKKTLKTSPILNNDSSNLEEEILHLQRVISELSAENNNLSIQLNSKDSQIKSQQQDLENKDFEIAYYKKLIFGRRSEKAKYLNIDEKQLSLFDDIERYDDKLEEKAEVKLSDDVKEILQERQRLKLLEKEYKKNNASKKTFRVSNPDIKVERKEIDIADSEKKCHCGSCLTKIGEEKSETIEYIAASLKIVENVRFKYACKNCQENVKIAKKADKVFDRTAASSSLLSHILTSKFEDHLPFYRQNKIFKRYGINIDDKLMSNWHYKSAKRFAPLVMLLKDEITSSNYIAIDETTVTSIDKSQTNQPYMWVYQSKSPDKKLLYYDYCLDRSSKNPQLILNQSHQDYIQTDGYSGK